MTEIGYRLGQKRNIITALPGPRSQALAARRKDAVAAGVGSVPVYAADADGGVIVDVDGNSLIDLGSGIAVTSVGAPTRASSPRSPIRRALHPHLFHGHAVRGVRRRWPSASPADAR